MIVRTLEKAQNSARKIQAKNWESVRLLLRSDQMGFSFHITTIYAGTSTHMHYRNHLEAVYCLQGNAVIEMVDGKQYEISPGTLYALDKHDEHVLHAQSELTLICIFDPALIGTETHDENGVYPLEADIVQD
ncbi:MAG: ectoine synthase [Gammaproteobacteria bacterium]|nr:ectoine synthase [Gammaproteobacteria bacterium]